MEEAPYQFEDTVNLFDYGFANFSYSRISDFENTFDTGSNYLSDSTYGSLISLNTDVKVLLPNSADLSNITSDITYRESSTPYFADVNYYYNGYYIGKAGLSYNPITTSIDEIKLSGINTNKDVKITIINVKKVFLIVLLAFAGVLIIIRLIILIKKLILKQKEKAKRNQKFNQSVNSKRKKRKIAKRYKKNRH